MRYVCALSSIAVVLTALQLSSSWRIRANERSGLLIDVSGRQSMLSQRIAMLAGEAVRQIGTRALETSNAELGDAIRHMERNHALLVADWKRRAARGDAAFAATLADDGPELLVDSFLINARSVRASIDEGASEAERLIGRNTALALSATARGELLDRLGTVVAEYVRQERAGIASIDRIGWVCVVVGLTLLIGLARFVFRPMVVRIVTTIDELRTSAYPNVLGYVVKPLDTDDLDSLGDLLGGGGGAERAA